MRKCISCGKNFDNDNINICPECGGDTRRVLNKIAYQNIIIVAALVAVIALVAFLAVSNSGKIQNNNDTAVSDGPVYEDPRFEKFETALIGKKLEYKKVMKKNHTEVGAKEAYGYEFDNNFVVELYVYDENSDIYKEAVKNNLIPLVNYGNTIPVKFNGTMCLYMSNYQHEYSDEINEIFKNLK